MRFVPCAFATRAALTVVLLAAPAARAQAPADTAALRVRLDELQLEARAVDAQRDALGARLAALDSRADSLSVEIAAASSAVRTARHGPARSTPARTSTAATIYAGPDWASIRLALVPALTEVEVLDRASDGVSQFYLVRFGGRTGYVPVASVAGGPELAARFGPEAGDGAAAAPAVKLPPAPDAPAPVASAAHTSSAAGPPAAGAEGVLEPAVEIVVGSRNGEVYHLPTCRHAARIAPGNLTTFASAAEARAAGRRPCQVCLRE